MPQSLQMLLWRLCSHFLRPLCGALTRCLCLPLSNPSRLPLLHRIVGLLPRLVAVSPLLAALSFTESGLMTVERTVFFLAPSQVRWAE